MKIEIEIPDFVVREFNALRHFWAAHEIDIVARKDGREYRLEADWLKQALHPHQDRTASKHSAHSAIPARNTSIEDKPW